jgi:hypothetical protein
MNRVSAVWLVRLASVLAGFVFATSGFATNSNSYVCLPDQIDIINSARPGAETVCRAKPYVLSCQDDGRYACCKSACDCIFTGRVALNKGWGSGSRSYLTYPIGGSCPPPTKGAPITATPSTMK